MSKPSIFDALKEIDLDDWLTYAGVTHRTGGTDNIGIQTCPACGNPNWKVRLSKSKHVGYCFHASCETRFNLFTFAKAYLGEDTGATLRHFEEYLGTSFVRANSVAERPAMTVADDWQLPASIPLPTAEGHTHPMLTQRRIMPETQREFGLRYCHEGHFSYRNEYGPQSQVFDRRIILPVADLDGHIKTFQGRATWDVDEEFGEKRYLFPIGLPGSSHFLYGGHLVKGKRRLLAVEGPFDCMSSHQAIKGHPDFIDMGVVGTFGLSLGHSDSAGDDQLGRLRDLMKHGLEEVIIMWDAEKKAYHNALKIALVLLAAGLRVRVAMLPVGADPNDVETRVIREAIEQSQPVTRLTYPALLLKTPFA